MVFVFWLTGAPQAQEASPQGDWSGGALGKPSTMPTIDLTVRHLPDLLCIRKEESICKEGRIIYLINRPYALYTTAP
jgi:hypothetical protein